MEVLIIYPYRCDDGCQHEFDIYKSYKDIDNTEHCPECNVVSQRKIAPSNLYAVGEWDYNEYNHGLGCWTKGTKHAEKIARSRGLEPVGNESVESLDKRNEADKARRHKAAWDSV